MFITGLGWITGADGAGSGGLFGGEGGAGGAEGVGGTATGYDGGGVVPLGGYFCIPPAIIIYRLVKVFVVMYHDGIEILVVFFPTDLYEMFHSTFPLIH